MKYFSIILLIFFISLSPAQAQYNAGSGLLILNVGFTMASPENSDLDLDGNTFSLSYERSDYQGRLAGGFVIGYTKTSADSQDSGGANVQRISALSHEVIPIMLFGKVQFGSPRLRGYVGGDFGVQFSQVRYYVPNGQVTSDDSGFLIGGVVGLNYFFNEKLLLNANYSLTYLGNSYYRDDLVHNISLGLGFQFY